MEYIKFTLDQKGLVSRITANDDAMYILGSFLASDVRGSGNSFGEWLDMEDNFCCSGNITYLEKEGNEIWLSDLYGEEDPPLHYCKLTREQFLYILDTWKKLYKQNPEEIILTKDGDDIKMEGRGFKKNYFSNVVHRIWTYLLKKLRRIKEG